MNEEIIMIVLFFIIIGIVCLSVYIIMKAQPVYEECKDDINIINRCGCVPCSWKDAEIYNKVPCAILNDSELGK